MPARYRIDKFLGVVFSTGEGVITAEDILTHGQRLRVDPDFDPSYNQLIDIRDAIKLGITTEDIPEIVALEDIFSEQCRRAIVAETNFMFAMGRMLQIYSESSAGRTHVFHDMDAARRWLGLNQAPNSN